MADVGSRPAVVAGLPWSSTTQDDEDETLSLAPCTSNVFFSLQQYLGSWCCCSLLLLAAAACCCCVLLLLLLVLLQLLLLLPLWPLL